MSDNLEVVSASVGAMNKPLSQLSLYKRNVAFGDNSNNIVFVINGIAFSISFSNDNYNSMVVFLSST